MRFFRSEEKSVAQLFESADALLKEMSSSLTAFENVLLCLDKCAIMKGQATLGDDQVATKEFFDAIGRGCTILSPHELLSSLLSALKYFRELVERKDKDQLVFSMIERRMQDLNDFYANIMIAIGTQANLQFLSGNYTRLLVESTIDNLKTYSVEMSREREKIVKKLNPSSELKVWGTEIAKHDKASLLKQWCFLALLLSLDVSHVKPKDPLLDVSAKRNTRLIQVIIEYTKTTNTNLFLMLSARMG